MSKVTVYISSSAGNIEMKKKQQKIVMVLEGQKVPFEILDIATSCDFKDRMREISNDPTALPPQICNGVEYCGDYEAFENAIESQQLEKFLKI